MLYKKDYKKHVYVFFSFRLMKIDFRGLKKPLVPDVEGEEGDVLAEEVTLHPLQPSHDLLRDLVQVLIYSKDTKLRRISLHVTDALLQAVPST